MPAKRPPKYAHHKPTGQARVRLNGKDVLGAFGSKESKERYAKIVAAGARPAPMTTGPN